jgi:chaperonin GroES
MAKSKKPAKKAVKKSVPVKKAKPAKRSTVKVAVKSKSQATIKSAAKPGSKTSQTAGSINLSPLKSRVLIRREEGETKTTGGLFIPDVAKDKPLSGRVVATGTGSYNKRGAKRPLDVQVGDRVLFGRYTGSQIKLNGEELLVLEEAEILGIIQD